MLDVLVGWISLLESQILLMPVARLLKQQLLPGSHLCAKGHLLGCSGAVPASHTDVSLLLLRRGEGSRNRTGTFDGKDLRNNGSPPLLLGKGTQDTLRVTNRLGSLSHLHNAALLHKPFDDQISRAP